MSYPVYSVACDHARMLILIADAEGDKQPFPAVYAVCGTCNGRGSHVNPAIDGNGLSAEDFAEDPDFAEDYRAGRYDVPCHDCDARRVVLVPSTDEGKAALATVMREHHTMMATERAERAMGA